MKKTQKNNGKPWTPSAIREVERLAAGNTPTRLIAVKTNRSEAAIRSIAARKGIYIRPANQSLYNRGDKP
jgi:hypothetical protein